MTSSFHNGPDRSTLSVLEAATIEGMDDEWEEVVVAAEADTSLIIELAARLLDDNAGEAYARSLEMPLASVPSTLCTAASMIATLAEHLAFHENLSTEQVLLELRNWMEEEPEGDSDG